MRPFMTTAVTECSFCEGNTPQVLVLEKKEGTEFMCPTCAQKVVAYFENRATTGDTVILTRPVSMNASGEQVTFAEGTTFYVTGRHEELPYIYVNEMVGGNRMRPQLQLPDDSYQLVSYGH